jgi:hypothetical protein
MNYSIHYFCFEGDFMVRGHYEKMGWRIGIIIGIPLGFAVAYILSWVYAIYMSAALEVMYGRSIEPGEIIPLLIGLIGAAFYVFFGGVVVTVAAFSGAFGAVSGVKKDRKIAEQAKMLAIRKGREGEFFGMSIFADYDRFVFLRENKEVAQAPLKNITDVRAWSNKTATTLVEKEQIPIEKKGEAIEKLIKIYESEKSKRNQKPSYVS